MDHLRQASLEIWQVVVDHLARVLFKNGLEDKQRSTGQEVTQCRLFGASQMRKNVILCMFKEQLGLGPKYYLLIALWITLVWPIFSALLGCCHPRKWCLNYIL